MKRHLLFDLRRRLQLWLRRFGLALPIALLGGCRLFDGSYLERGPTCVNRCADITAGAMPDPTGAHVARFIKVQAEKAEQDDFTIHRDEWFQGGKVLGPYGRYHIELIARKWGDNPFPVIIATSEIPELDAARRHFVVDMLARKGIDADPRVILGFPAAEGLYGEAMEPAYVQMLRGTQFGAFGNAYQGFGGGFGQGAGLGGFGGFGGFFGR
ncbi:MAG: hypothetical protein U0793_31545 [Gemmataceae bacterium]